MENKKFNFSKLNKSKQAKIVAANNKQVVTLNAKGYVNSIDNANVIETLANQGTVTATVLSASYYGLSDSGKPKVKLLLDKELYFWSVEEAALKTMHKVSLPTLSKFLVRCKLRTKGLGELLSDLEEDDIDSFLVELEGIEVTVRQYIDGTINEIVRPVSGTDIGSDLLEALNIYTN